MSKSQAVFIFKDNKIGYLFQEKSIKTSSEVLNRLNNTENYKVDVFTNPIQKYNNKKHEIIHCSIKNNTKDIVNKFNRIVIILCNKQTKTQQVNNYKSKYYTNLIKWYVYRYYLFQENN